MAAPVGSENMSNPNSDEESDERNILSPHFNPLKALYSSKVQLPFPQATIFNTLREYEWIVSSGDSGGRGRSRARDGGGHEAGDSRSSPSREKVQGRAGPSVQASNQRDSQPKSSRSPETTTRTRRRKDEQVPLGTGFRATQDMLIDSWKHKPTTVRNVITRMSEMTTGPLSVLYRCMDKRCKVSVCTRSFKGLRGVCTGYLVTFDKFYNMALVDVDEVWRRPSTGQRFYHEENITFSKIMECSRMQESQRLLQCDKSKTRHTREVDQSRRGDSTSEIQPQAPHRHHTDRPGRDSTPMSRHEDRRHSEKSRHRDSREHSHRDSREHSRKDHKEKSKIDQNRKSERQKSTRKDSLKSKERTAETASEQGAEDEDIEDLQKRLEALQRELTSLSDDDGGGDDDDDGAGGSSQRMEEKKEEENPESRLAALYSELASLSNDDDAVENLRCIQKIEEDKDSVTITESKDPLSINSKKINRALVEGSCATGQETGQSTTGESSKVMGECHPQDNGAVVEESREVKDQERGQSTESSKVKDDDEQHGNNVTDETKEGIGESSKVASAANKANVSVKRGRLKIKPEEFQRRHVNQLFIRGDNVVLVSVDSNLLPK